MRLARDEALRRLSKHDHGVLSTIHSERGIDSVPAVFAVDDEGFLGIPIDRVKPKLSTRLQREDNLDADPRAVLLVEQWDRDDWTRLWWVRARLERHDGDAAREDVLAGMLAARYEQYVDRPFERVLLFRITTVTGWSASG